MDLISARDEMKNVAGFPATALVIPLSAVVDARDEAIIRAVMSELTYPFQERVRPVLQAAIRDKPLPWDLVHPTLVAGELLKRDVSVQSDVLIRFQGAEKEVVAEAIREGFNQGVRRFWADGIPSLALEAANKMRHMITSMGAFAPQSP